MEKIDYGFNPKISGWAKTDSKGNPGLSIFEHCCNVGWVALELINKFKIMPHSQINPLDAAIIAAVHDVGKWSPGFLNMCPAWLEKEGLTLYAKRHNWKSQAGKEHRHEKYSQDSIQILLQSRGCKLAKAVSWAMVAGAHHGKMHLAETYRERDIQHQLITNIWQKQRIDIIKALESEFETELPSITIEKTDAVIMWLMGLTSVADWIASNEDYFPVGKGFNRDEGKTIAHQALQRIGFEKPQVKTGLHFNEIFGFNPNEIQKKAMSTIVEQGVYVIEAPMGLGKTEAALACAYNLMQSGKASGLYFALPTQLTSNRIHLRVSDFVKRITEHSDSTRLAHANAWLEKDYYQPKTVESLTEINDRFLDSSLGRDWFASSKRALLANFGVGTIDQALMSVVAVKHFFVRRFALAGKVVIIDEVHSYDYFTGTLINCLCRELEKLACTIIILSATLLPEVRNKLINVSKEGITSNSYPLITGKTNSEKLIEPKGAQPIARPPVKRIFKSEEAIFDDAVQAAKKGARVLWVCNTVNNAQKAFQELQNQIQNEPTQNCFELGLLHSRFPHFIRQKHESYWMERLGKKDKSKQGCILVSTQIVEQSVDIDSDIMISELAPIDMLLQRMGRLWRHIEDRPAANRAFEYPEIWLFQEKESLFNLKNTSSEKLKKLLGDKAKVYDPYVLLKTYQTLHSFDSINLSDENGNSDIRRLLELTYLNIDDDSESWSKLADDMMGVRLAKQKLAINHTRLFDKAALDDEEGKQTRLIEIETIPMLIATHIDDEKIVFLNGEEIPAKPDKFNIEHARAVHRNIVRVHAWRYEGVLPNPEIEFYVKGKHCLALLDENNCLKIEGLKSGISIEWSESIGIKESSNKGEEYESCD